MRNQLYKKKVNNHTHTNNVESGHSSFIKPTVQSMITQNKNAEVKESERKAAVKNSEEAEKEQSPVNSENAEMNEKESQVEAKNAEAQESEETAAVKNSEEGEKEQSAENSENPAMNEKEDQAVASNQEVAAPPTVSIGKVNATSTPAGMPDRLPPRVDTNVAVTVSGHAASTDNIQFSVEGGNAANGNATVNGTNAHTQNSDGILNIKGTTQTSPGSAGNLKVVAKQGGNVLAESNSFSVSSIPQNFSVSFDRLLNADDSWGIRVNNDWESDSGNVADLDQAERSESVETKTRTGVFATIPTDNHNSGYNAGHTPPRGDSHTLGPGSVLKRLHGNGSFGFDQVFLLWDKRTGAKDITARNSGFNISQDLTYDAAGPTTTLTTTKQGANATANGNSSNAGTGIASRPQVL